MASEKIITPKARLSYPHLFKMEQPMAGSNSGPAYTATLLFPKTTDMTLFKKAIEAAIVAKWPDQATRPKGLKLPIRDGDEKDKPGYAGCYYIKVRSQTKPGVVDENVQPIMEEGKIYGGCYVRASLTCYGYDKGGGRGVSFGLLNIQKLADGEPFGRAASDPDDDFQAAASTGGTAKEDWEP
jgi:hypothetical protein